MASVVELARDFYNQGCKDPSFAASLADYHKQILVSVMSGDRCGDVVQGSKNGSSYTIRPAYSLDERRQAISLALICLKAGTPPTNTQKSRF